AASADRLWKKGAVATANPIATAAAIEMLDKGGNATDAAVAAAFALAAARPFSSGLGGGGFALVADGKTGEVSALDFREVAPRGASAEMFVREGKVKAGLSTEGALAVAVPGAVAGYFEL